MRNFGKCKVPGCSDRKKYSDRIVRREVVSANTEHVTVECDKKHRWILSLLAAIFIAACHNSTTPDANHALQATKGLCEYRHDCLGIERDYPQCEADAIACGVEAVEACLATSDCSDAASCLEAECGRGAGLGLEP